MQKHAKAWRGVGCVMRLEVNRNARRLFGMQRWELGRKAVTLQRQGELRKHIISQVNMKNDSSFFCFPPLWIPFKPC